MLLVCPNNLRIRSIRWRGVVISLFLFVLSTIDTTEMALVALNSTRYENRIPIWNANSDFHIMATEGYPRNISAPHRRYRAMECQVIITL
jgi:hypothetical protein